MDRRAASTKPRLPRCCLNWLEVVMKLKALLPEAPKLSNEADQKLKQEMADLRKLREMVRQAENDRTTSKLYKLG